jgi:hypothetical protein
MHRRPVKLAVRIVSILLTSCANVEGTPATKPTTPPQRVLPDANQPVALAGTWICRPTVWQQKARKNLVERNVKPEELDLRLAELVQGMRNYRLVYTFAGDGTGKRDYGFDGTTSKATPIKWKVAADAKPTVGGTARIEVTLADETVETLPVTFVAADRFTVILPGKTYPIENPVTFVRGELSPANIASIAFVMPRDDADLMHVIAMTKPLGLRMAALLNATFDEMSDLEVGGFSVTGTSFAAKNLNMKNDRTAATLTLSCVEILQPPGGRGDPVELLSTIDFVLRRDKTKWTCVRVTKHYVQEPGGRPRQPIVLTRGYRRFVDLAQGFAVPVAQPLTEDDMQPVQGEVGKDLQELAASIRRNMAKAVEADRVGMPEFGRVDANDGMLTRTRSGAVVARFMLTTSLNFVNRNGGPADFATLRQSVTVVLKQDSQGKWRCVNASLAFVGATGRNGPIDIRHADDADWTADVQEWIDGQSPQPISR